MVSPIIDVINMDNFQYVGASSNLKGGELFSSKKNEAKRKMLAISRHSYLHQTYNFGQFLAEIRLNYEVPVFQNVVIFVKNQLEFQK